MKLAALCPKAVLTLVLSATPVIAQNTGNPELDAPITLHQEQVLTELRDRDRDTFFDVREKSFMHLKPISKWTQADVNSFKFEYDRHFKGEAHKNLTFDEFALAIFFDGIFGETEGSDGEGSD